MDRWGRALVCWFCLGGRLLRRPRRRAVGFDVMGVPSKIALVKVLDVAWGLELMILVGIDDEEGFAAEGFE